MNNNEKRTFLSIVGNIWYYYKWHIIVGLCAVIMFAVAFTQYFSKVEPDVFFYYVGKSGPTAKDIDELCTQMQEIVPNDCNGDGKIKVSYKEDIFVMYSPDSESPDAGSYVYNTSEQMNIVQRFNFELGMGDCIVYIMEPNLFKANTDYIMSLEDILGYVPENAVMGKGIRITDLKAYRDTAFSSFPDECIICLRGKRKGDDETVYNGNVEFFKSLVEWK